MERSVHRLYVATFDLRCVVWELYAVISKSGAENTRSSSIAWI